MNVMLQVGTIIRNSFKEALSQNDILISPAAPSAAYKIGKHLHLFAFALLLFNSLFFILFATCFFFFREVAVLLPRVASSFPVSGSLSSILLRASVVSFFIEVSLLSLLLFPASVVLLPLFLV